MIYCFDIDGTICTNTDGKYNLAIPDLESLKKIDSLLVIIGYGSEKNKILNFIKLNDLNSSYSISCTFELVKIDFNTSRYLFILILCLSLSTHFNYYNTKR